ncbi:hypothetical protein DIPPA_15680, partial [Diplonema papillatum]
PFLRNTSKIVVRHRAPATPLIPGCHRQPTQQNVAAYVVSNRGPHCEEKTGHLPVIKAATDITRGIFQRAISYGAKKKTDAFTKWQKVDETADKDIPLPQAPVKEHVDETAEETFDEADISNQEA